MPEATNNSAIEDGSAGSSPPPSSQSADGGNSASDKSGVKGGLTGLRNTAVDSQVSSSERAPGGSGQNEIDPLDAIYDELAAKGEQTKQSRSTSPSKAEDTNAENPTPPPAAAAVNTAAATNKDPKDAKQQQRQTAEYEGLTPDARGLLKSTNLLIEPAVWNAMPEAFRSSVIESAKAIRAEKERLFQEKAQGQQQNQQGNQGGQQQQNSPQAQGNQAAATPQQIEAAYTQLGSFGEDLVKPVRAIFDHQQQQFTGHLNTLTEQFKEALHSERERIDFLVKRLIKSEEHAAFEGDELKTLKALPEFADKTVREEINRNARALLRAQWSAGNRDFTLKEAIVQAAHTRFFDQQQQAAQAALVDDRKRSLRGTSARPAAVVPAVKAAPKNESDVMDEVYDRLYAAKAR